MAPCVSVPSPRLALLSHLAASCAELRPCLRAMLSGPCLLHHLSHQWYFAPPTPHRTPPMGSWATCFKLYRSWSRRSASSRPARREGAGAASLFHRVAALAAPASSVLYSEGVHRPVGRFVQCWLQPRGPGCASTCRSHFSSASSFSLSR